MNHTCIKPSCGNTYQDNDPDAYYCPSCLKEKKRIAAEIDKKLAGRPKTPVMSELQAYEASAKVMKTPDGRTVTFGRVMP